MATARVGIKGLLNTDLKYLNNMKDNIIKKITKFKSKEPEFKSSNGDGWIEGEGVRFIPLDILRLTIYLVDRGRFKITKFLNPTDGIKELKDMLEVSASQNNNGAVVWDEEYQILVLSFGKNISLRTVVHEVTHIVDYLSKWRGFQNEMEFRAYLAGHLTQLLVDRLKLNLE